MGPSCTPVLAVVTRIYPSVKAHNAAHTKLIPLLKRKHFICKRKAGAPLAVWGERMGTETRREAGTLLRGPRGQPPLACVPHLSQPQRGPCLGRPRHPKARFPSSAPSGSPMRGSPSAATSTALHPTSTPQRPQVSDPDPKDPSLSRPPGDPLHI